MSAPREAGDFSPPTLHTARRAPVAPRRPGGDPSDPFALRSDRPGPGPDAPGRAAPHSSDWNDRTPATAPDAAAVRSTRTAFGRRSGWFAVSTLVAVTSVGVLIDVVLGTSVAVNYGIILASLVAILSVRPREMFPVLIAPPLVYVVASAAVLFLRSGGPRSTRVLYDFGANWLVYGFPSIAAATAVVLVIGSVRYITRR